MVAYFEGENIGTGRMKSIEYKNTKISHFFAIAGIGFPVTQRDENLRERRKGREESHYGVSFFILLFYTSIFKNLVSHPLFFQDDRQHFSSTMPETQFVNIEEAQVSIPRNRFCQPM